MRPSVVAFRLASPVFSIFSWSKRSLIVVVKFLIGVPIDFFGDMAVYVEVGCSSPGE